MGELLEKTVLMTMAGVVKPSPTPAEA